MKYTDAHCHILTSTLIPTECLGIISCATNMSEWDKMIGEPSDTIFTCIGIHPWNINNLPRGWEQDMYDLLKQNQHIMVGEIGLDKYHPDMENQETIFIQQMQIAEQINRPIHIHCVGAWDKILHIFRTNKMPPLVVAHAFNGPIDIIQKLAQDYNMYFSYSVPHDDGKSIERIAATPLGRLLVESDAYDVQTAQGTVQQTLEKFSTILGLSPDEISEQIYQNFQKVISYVRPID